MIFGADERHEVTISQAVQASTALPDLLQAGAHQRRRLRRRRHPPHRQHRRRDREGRGPHHLLQPVPALPEPHRPGGAQPLLRRRPLPLRPRHEDGDQPGVPHAAPLAAQHGAPALPGGRALPGRHRARSSRASRTPTSSASTRSRSGGAPTRSAHGFESVRATIEQNYERSPTCSRRYGLRMDRRAAQRRAVRAARQPRLEGQRSRERGGRRLRPTSGWSAASASPGPPGRAAEPEPSKHGFPGSLLPRGRRVSSALTRGRRHPRARRPSSRCAR